MPSRQRVRERAAVDIFELAADRHAVRDAARSHLMTLRELGDHVRRRIAFDRRVRRENRFFDAARRRATLRAARIPARRDRCRRAATDGPSARSTCRDSCRTARSRQRPQATRPRTAATDRERTPSRSGTARRRRTCGSAGSGPTPSTAFCNASAQQAGAVAILLQQMERHALRGFRPDAGQAAQRFDQANQGRRIDHERRPRTASSYRAAAACRPSRSTSSPASRARPSARRR